AEDGIRDGHVTGVQTCALPISLSRVQIGMIAIMVPSLILVQRFGFEGFCARHALLAFANGLTLYLVRPVKSSPCLSVATLRYLRSEERRVGKEGRSLWWMELVW